MPDQGQPNTAITISTPFSVPDRSTISILKSAPESMPERSTISILKSAPESSTISIPKSAPESVPESTLLVGSDEFKHDFEAHARDAKKRLLIQCMTLEGDQAGTWLIETMLSSRARHKMIVFDDYSNVVVNDTFVYGPKGLFDRDLHAERKKLKTLLATAESRGVKIKTTNKIGFRPDKYPFRNHKKSVVSDDQVWLGGINISDHNFSWNDLMIRFGDRELADAVADDIHSNAEGVPTSQMIDWGSHTLYLLNYRDKSVSDKLYHDILSATTSIDIISPYITDPLLGLLKERSDTLDIRIYSPANNNKSVFTRYLRSIHREGWFQLFELPGTMSHMKVILTDHDTLFIGSSNFDFASYYFEDEIMIRSTDSQLIRQFIDRVLDVYRRDAKQIDKSEFYRSTKLGLDLLIRVISKLDKHKSYAMDR